MFAYLTRLQRNRKGFTLIELMVVVVILGILAGAAIMTLGGGQSDKAKRARAASDISTFMSALEFYKLDVGSYPASLDNLVTKPDSDADGWEGPYMKNIPKDPNGKDYEYTPTDDRDSYTIESSVNGEGGEPISDSNLDGTATP